MEEAVVDQSTEPNSTHRVEVVPVVLTPHPNADTLSIIRLLDGYQVVGKTEAWADKTIAAYVPPDSLVPLDRPEFAWFDQFIEYLELENRELCENSKE